MLDLKLAHQYFQLLRMRFDMEADRLNTLDAAIGDGDHGYTMQRAFKAVELACRNFNGDLGQLFDLTASTLAETSGGAIGPLLAAFFAEGALVFAGQKSADLSQTVLFFQRGLQAVMEVGGAAPGNKTLIDALAPAVSALERAQHASFREAMQKASFEAQRGARNTASMQAMHGRAAFIGQRAIGHPDPGAISMGILIDSLVQALNGAAVLNYRDKPETQFNPPPGKLINHPDEMVQEDNLGLTLAYPELVACNDTGVLIRAQPKANGKVGLAIGHGGGHTPSMGGFVGPGMLDADVYGPVFTCASGVRIAQAIQAAERGAGVVLLVSNHSGDVLNARLAVRRAQQAQIDVRPVVLGDDVATAPRERLSERRGLGGLLFALKIGGGAAEAGLPIAEVVRLMEKTNQRTATLSVAVRPPTHPTSGKLMFELPHGQIEIGTGVHGEIGVYRGQHLPAAAVIEKLLEHLLPDLAAFSADSMLAFINGAGGTSRMELHILYADLIRSMRKRDLRITAGVVDSLFTTQEMGGFSLSLCAVDEELLRYWQMPASAAAFRWPYQ